MRKILQLFFALVVVYLLIGGSTARADTVGWDSRFFALYPIKMGSLEAFNLTGAFAGNGFADFSNSSWSSQLIDTDYTVATGNPTRLIWFDLLFATPRSEEISLAVLAWRGAPLTSDLLWASSLEWSDCRWEVERLRDFEGLDRTPTAAPVPEPNTLSLLGAGMIGIAGYCWRKKGGGGRQ